MPRLKMGYDALFRLGPREQDLVDSCSGEVATDGHVIGSRSCANSLSEKGYRL